MTPPDRLGEIEALEKMLEADGALYPTYANKLIAIARRQMERADKAEAACIHYGVDEHNALQSALDAQTKRAERAEADRDQFAALARKAEAEVSDWKDAWNTHNAALKRYEEAVDRLEEAADWRLMQMRTAKEDAERLKKERDAARARWLQACDGWNAERAEVKKARADADTLTGYLNGAEARADKWKAEADALRAALQDYVDADPMTDSLLAKAKAALAGAAEADCDCDLNASEGKHDASCQSPKGQSGEGAASKPMIQTPAAARPGRCTHGFRTGEGLHFVPNGGWTICPESKPAPPPASALERELETTPSVAPPPEACPGKPLALGTITVPVHCAWCNGAGLGWKGACRNPEHCPACPSRRR